MAILKRTHLLRLAADARTTAQWLEKNAELIARRANDDTDSGFSSGGGTGRSSGINRPTERKALNPSLDDTTHQARRLERSLTAAQKALRAAQDAGTAIIGLPFPEAFALATFDEIADEQKLNTECANPACGALVSRTANDRLRSGRCMNCYQYRRRTGLERPRPLCDLDKTPEPTIDELVHGDITTTGDSLQQHDPAQSQ